MFPITVERRISLQNVNINQIKADYGTDWTECAYRISLACELTAMKLKTENYSRIKIPERIKTLIILWFLDSLHIAHEYQFSFVFLIARCERMPLADAR